MGPVLISLENRPHLAFIILTLDMKAGRSQDSATAWLAARKQTKLDGWLAGGVSPAETPPTSHPSWSFHGLKQFNLNCLQLPTCMDGLIQGD